MPAQWRGHGRTPGVPYGFNFGRANLRSGRDVSAFLGGQATGWAGGIDICASAGSAKVRIEGVLGASESGAD